MAAGINYHIHTRTSFSKDGFVFLWRLDPQKDIVTKTKIRRMTKKEIKNHVESCDKQNKKYWLNDSVIWG